MKRKELHVSRWLPEREKMVTETFIVPEEPGATVLQALLYIYDEVDSTLAFRYSCRYLRCGLCGLQARGKPRLACRTKLAGVNEIAPLPRLPLLRDLVVDRTAYFNTIQGLALYPVGPVEQPPVILREEPLHRNLMTCLECLCCVASCPTYHFGEPGFAGPYLFIKLGQLYLDPRDMADRKAQAREWGIRCCSGCKKCVCPNGVRLRETIMLLSS